MDERALHNKVQAAAEQVIDVAEMSKRILPADVREFLARGLLDKQDSLAQKNILAMPSIADGIIKSNASAKPMAHVKGRQHT